MTIIVQLALYGQSYVVLYSFLLAGTSENVISVTLHPRGGGNALMNHKKVYHLLSRVALTNPLHMGEVVVTLLASFCKLPSLL